MREKREGGWEGGREGGREGGIKRGRWAREQQERRKGNEFC